MKVVHTISELRRELAGQSDIGFVPTMGALHAGHASLLKRARAERQCVVLSIFVNPTQFGPSEDLSKYPRPLDADLAVAKADGVDVVFLPSVEEMYKRQDVVVHVEGPGQQWEGAFRPGHFDGVATVVAKLFLAVGTCRAYFGLKDLQQCAVVRALVEGLGIPVELVFCETVRETNGLAMSSRNAYLSLEDRDGAAQIYQFLSQLSSRIKIGYDISQIDICLSQTKQQLQDAGFQVDYLALVDPSSMASSTVASDSDRIIVAVRWKGVRLIDNVPIT